MRVPHQTDPLPFANTNAFTRGDSDRMAPLFAKSAPMHPETVKTDNHRESLARTPERFHKLSVIVCLAIFTVALGGRFLAWQDNRRDVWKVETFVTSEYKDSARQLLRGDVGSF